MSRKSNKKTNDIMDKIESKGKPNASSSYINAFEESIQKDEEEEKSKEQNKNNNNSNVDDNDKNNDNDDIKYTSTDKPETDDRFWNELKRDDGKKPEPKKNKVLTTFYMEPDLNDVVNEIATKQGKGAKSKLINESIRLALKENGLY